MYCKNCGQEIDDNADICIHCGVKTGKTTPQNSSSNTIAIVGFVLSFFISIAGLVCSIIGLVKSKDCGGKGKGFAIAGIVIAAASMIFSIFIYDAMLEMLKELAQEQSKLLSLL